MIGLAVSIKYKLKSAEISSFMILIIKPNDKTGEQAQINIKLA